MKTNKIAFVVDGYYGLSLYRYAKSEFGKIINFEGLVIQLAPLWRTSFRRNVFHRQVYVITTWART